MEYINFGKTGMKVSRFGLGCMRFPEDEAEAIKIVRTAIDRGVNYLDTAYIYPGSEEILGKALKEGYRDRIRLVTKCPVINVEKYDDLEKYLDEQLLRLNTDHLDLYLMHNISPAIQAKVKNLDLQGFYEKMKKKGKVLFGGFSIHNSFEAFKEIIEYCDWDMVQMQLNILDEESQAGGVEGLKYAASKGLPVTIMEPLRGGSLISDLTPKGAEILKNSPVKYSLPEIAFRWLYNKPEVSVILSGVSTTEQLEDNLRIFENSKPNVMSESEEKLVEELRESYKTEQIIGCTDCKYCMPCTKNVLIPSTFAFYNKYMLTKDESLKKAYMAGGRKADLCVMCGKCAKHCPQGLDIPVLLKEAYKVLSA